MPVNIDDPRPAGSTGMTQAQLAVTYDPAVLSVSAADVRLGTVPAAGSGWTLQAVVDQATGQIGITLFSATPITSSAGGSLVTITFHVRPGAAGTTPINLAASVNPTGRYCAADRRGRQPGPVHPAPGADRRRHGRRGRLGDPAGGRRASPLDNLSVIGMAAPPAVLASLGARRDPSRSRRNT